FGVDSSLTFLDGEFTTPAKMLTYKNSPQGFLPTMDNDAATMSSVYVSGALGLFPVTAGADSFQIGSPLFEKTTIHYPGGKDFVIEADGVNADNFYIQDATLNGKALDRTWLSFGEMVSGGVLHFDMGATASDWGEDGPMAYTMSDEVPSSVYDPASPLATASQVFEEAEANDGSIGNAISVTASGASFAGAAGADLTSQVTATGLPDGLSLTATRDASGTLSLALAGRAAHHLVDDSTDGVVVTLAEGAFTGTAPSLESRTLALKVRFAGYGLTPSTTTITAGSGGVVDTSVELALSGGASFAGEVGAQLPAGAYSLPGLPAGLASSLTKTAATTATLTIEGTLASQAASTFILALADSALSGASAAQVGGPGTTAIDPFRVSLESTTRADLQALYDEARLVTADDYSAGSFATLRAAVAAAKDALADADSSELVLGRALANLTAAIDGLVIGDGAYRLLQAEAYDLWSGGSLKTESGGTGTNVGGVAPGSWLAYRGMDFGEDQLGSFVISYSHNPSSASASAKVELRTGSVTGPLVMTLDLPTTNGWANYTQLSHAFSATELQALEGVNDLYLVFLGSADKSWVANLDYFQFVPAVVQAPTELTVEFESLAAANGTFDADASLVAGTDYQNGTGGSASQNQLKTEANNGGRTLSGVTSGAWVRYQGVDLGSRKSSTLKVTYDAPSGRVAAAKVAVHVDSMTGSPLVEASLANTGSGWGTYATVSIDLPNALTGSHTLYLSFSSTPTTDLPYVGNFDSFALVYDEEDTTPFVFTQLTPNNVTQLGPNVGRDGSAGAYTNFGNTHEEEWVKYAAVDFGPNGADTLSLNYDKPNNDRSTDKTWVEVRLGSNTGTTVAATAMLPRTGSSWGTYQTVSIAVDPSIFTGTQDVFFVFRMSPVNTNQSNPYVGNFKWFQFGDSTAAGGTQKTVQFESVRSGTGTLSAAGLVSGTDYSGDGLKTEVSSANTSITQLAGTGNGNWVRYRNVNVGENFATSLSVTYDAPGDKAISPKLAVYLDSMDADPFVVASLPNTAVSGWGTFQTVSIPLPSELTGNHTLYFEFRSSPSGSATYVGNFDSFTLGYGVDKAALRAVVAGVTGLVEHKDRYLAADYGVFSRALAAANTVLADPTATATEVAAAQRTLTLSAKRLQWKVVKQLADWVTKAEAVKEADATPASYAALRSALAAAKALTTDENTYGEYEAAVTDLSAAYRDLVGFEPTLAGPAEPVQPGSEVEFTGAGFAPGEVVSFSWTAEPVLTPPWTATATPDGDVTTTVTVPATTVDGSYEVTAVGATTARPVVATVTVVKVMLASTTSFLGVPAEAVDGDPVPVSVGVTEGATGTVELFDGSTSLGEEELADGQAAFTLTTLGVGSHTLTAAYSGDDWYLASTSEAVTLTVTPKTTPPVQTVKISTPVLDRASQAYDSVTARRAIIATTISGVKAGKVTFRAGSKVLATATVAGSGRVALRLPGTLPIGTYRGLTATVVTSTGTTVTSTASAARFTVVKASTSKVKVTAAKFRRGTRPKLKVTVATLSSGRVATGKVKIYVGSKVVKTVRLTTKMKGKVTVTLPKRYYSTIKVKAKFVPTSTRTVESKSSKVLKLKTRR
ncbi:MAG: carbohydrate-binding protein, partial [Propionicimonas sp.]|nr:carbohydrate-binding protein [Propionicimonas sp.]